MTLEEAQQLVAREVLPYHERAVAAIIGGSIARGEATATSDIDLFLLFEDVPRAWRDTFRIGGQTVELFGHDLRTFDYFCRELDRPSGRVPLAMMVLDGKNILPPSAAYSALSALAQDFYDGGPPPLTVEALASRRYEITNLLEDLVDSTEADETLAVATKLYDALATFVLRAGGAWIGVGKHLARRLRAHDPKIADHLHAAMVLVVTDTPAGKQAFTQLVEDALHPYGGLLLEGHLLYAPAEWKSDAVGSE